MKSLGNVEYEGKEVVVGPARVRQKRSALFRGRPDQLWQTTLPGMQQPVYYSVSQDGAWYFQPSVPPQVVSVVPTNQVSSYAAQANCWPSAQYQMPAYPQSTVQYAASQYTTNQYTGNPVNTPVVSASYPVGKFVTFSTITSTLH